MTRKLMPVHNGLLQKWKESRHFCAQAKHGIASIFGLHSPGRISDDPRHSAERCIEENSLW